jgi:hypothetical protein
VKNKYSIAELDKMTVLPEDCNEIAEAYAEQFRDPGLMVMLRMFREKKITKGYGEATHLGKTGSPDAIFSFQAGVCKHASPIHWFDKTNVAKGSVKFY